MEVRFILAILLVLAILLFIIIPFISLCKRASRIKGDVNEYIGRIGEKQTEYILRRLNCCKYILTNLYVTVKEKTTEVDLVGFTDRGLLVVETKNVCGVISGNENDEKWYAEDYTRIKSFGNPIKQNANHVYFVDRAIGQNIPIYSIIVFTDRASIENVPSSFGDVYICKTSTLRHVINEIFEENLACISSFNLDKIYNKLEKYTHPSEETIQRHREYVVNKKLANSK